MPKWDSLRKTARDSRIYKYHLKHPVLSETELGVKFKLSRSNIARILNNEKRKAASSSTPSSCPWGIIGQNCPILKTLLLLETIIKQSRKNGLKVYTNSQDIAIILGKLRIPATFIKDIKGGRYEE